MVFDLPGKKQSISSNGPTCWLSLCHGPPDKASNGDDGGYDEQPPNQPEDADKHERGHDDSKENSD